MTGRPRVLFAVRALLVAIALTPLLLPALAGAAALGWLARPLEAWFAFQCERDPARMLALGAVCARCLGIYAGIGFGALIAWPRTRSRRLELAVALAAIAMLADVGSEWLGWRPAWAPLRVGTGVALGYAATVLLVCAVDSLPARVTSPRSTPE